LYGPFSCIDSVICRFDKLPLAFLFCEVLFDGVGCLVVRNIELRLESLVVERVEHLFEAFNDGRIRLILNWDGEYVICILVICDKIVLVAI